MQDCCDISWQYVHTRDQFEQKIGHFQPSQANMAKPTVSLFLFLFTEATHKVSQGPLKGVVSVQIQKALQGSGTDTWELPGGTEENSEVRE